MSRWILIDIVIELFSIKSRKKLRIFNSFSSSYPLSWPFMFSTCKHITKDNKTIKTLCHFLCLQYVKHMVCWKEHSWWPWLKNIKHKPKILYFAKLVCMMWRKHKLFFIHWMKEYESFKCNTHKKMNANKSVQGGGA